MMLDNFNMSVANVWVGSGALLAVARGHLLQLACTPPWALRRLHSRHWLLLSLLF